MVPKIKKGAAGAFNQQARSTAAPQSHTHNIVKTTGQTTTGRMLSTNLLRTTRRRLVSSAFSQAKRASSSSSRQVTKLASEQEARTLLPIVTAATFVCGWGLLTSQENEDAKSAHCLVKKTNTKAREVEAKFAAYWPRNIMILFGPPGRSIYFLVQVRDCHRGQFPMTKHTINRTRSQILTLSHIRRRKGDSRS